MALDGRNTLCCSQSAGEEQELIMLDISSSFHSPLVSVHWLESPEAVNKEDLIMSIRCLIRAGDRKEECGSMNQENIP